VRDVFTRLCRPGRRTGAVMLVDDNGRLCGLFTDSDLARLLEQRRDEQLDRPIAEVMTAGPLTLSHDAILEEAVQLLGSRRLSELPVIDAEHRPVGMIDITDVIGLMPAEPG
jgi:arabinose-5-phosphate isomerase